MTKSLRLSTVLIIILLAIIAAIVFFGYFYQTGRSPLLKLAPGSSLTEPKLVTTFDGGQQRLARPLALAVGAQGNIYVADTGNNRITVFNSKGELINFFGGTGNREGQLNFPSGISISRSGKVYVADYKNNRVAVFDTDGKFLRVVASGSISGLDGKPLMFSPVTLVVDAQEHLYISDTFRQRILVLDSNGQLLRVIGREGGRPGEILYANGLAVDEKGKQLIVSDSNNARIQAFDLEGKFLWQQDKIGKSSKLVVPKGVVVADGIIYVADSLAQRIAAFDTQGKFLYMFGSRSADVDGFNFPSGLAWSPELSYLLISDRENDRIDIYR